MSSILPETRNSSTRYNDLAIHTVHMYFGREDPDCEYCKTGFGLASEAPGGFAATS